MSSSIVWSEGMFIAPQHFQHFDIAMQRYVNEVAQLDLHAGDYGVSELELNTDALAMGKFAVRRAAGVLPDRLFFRLAKELVMDIPDGLVDEIVYIAVPLAITGTAHFGEAGETARMIKARRDLRDLNDPDNEPVETEMADVGACLQLGNVDLSGFATIAIARILEKTAEGRVILDRAFMPQAVDLRAARILSERLEETIALARVRAANAAGRVATETGMRSEASLMTERLELQVLNRWLLVLQNARHLGRISPRALFSHLASLSVEMDAILGKATPETLLFDPEKMAESFEEVLGSLRRKLTLEKPASVMALAWNTELFEARRLLRLIIPSRVLAEERRPILALSGPDGATALAETGPLACKLAGLSAMPELVSRGLPGVDLTPLSAAPAELRSRSDAAFFTINTSSAHWQRFLNKREALALHVDDRISTVDATLYMLG
ncbi:MAG: type VI secretion system baseplate subunit TssK [Spiribacter salinus]|uniref:Type VI secretion system baseplate subunit TssK n=1 Tax=Spiribacter salinus TaxID=1335746 RepID=A0A540VTK0_9GAMM|nr:MAG: type VI secretion system baseplate subunit TssK [Spiribacter salinus]